MSIPEQERIMRETRRQSHTIHETAPRTVIMARPRNTAAFPLTDMEGRPIRLRDLAAVDPDREAIDMADQSERPTRGRGIHIERKTHMAFLRFQSQPTAVRGQGDAKARRHGMSPPTLRNTPVLDRPGPRLPGDRRGTPLPASARTGRPR